MPDKGHEAADKELKRLEKALSKHYAQAAKELTKKAEEFMRDFERKDTQMKKLVEAGKMTEQDYMNWRRNQMMTEERIQDMKDTLAKDLTNADQIAAGMINDTLPSAYAENFNFGTYEIETGSTIDTSFSLYDKKTVENLMKKDPKIIPKARVDIPKDELWNRQKLTSAIAQGILQGESIPKIATRLQTVADMDRNAAIRNARTYTTAAENKGRVDSIARANEMGIPSDQEWIAVLDDRTRMEHRHLDGQVRPVGEPFSADGYRIMYPGDPDAEPEMIYNCRCTLVSRVRGRIYNDERNDSKLDGMSYDEWKHAKDRQMEPPKEEEKQEGEPIKINSDDWTNWAIDPEPYQQALNGEEISDYLGGEKLSEEEKERISKVAEEIQNRAENEVVPYDTLFRGESYSSLEEAMEKYKEGSVIINDKLTSYATTSEIAKEYAESGGGIKVIITNTNTQDDVPGSVGVMTDPLGAGGSSEVITAKGMESKVFSSYYDEEEKTLYVGMTNDAEPKSEAGKEETQKEEPAATYKTFTDMPDKKTETIGRYVRDGEVIKEGHEVEYATTYKGDGSAVSEFFGKISNNKELIDEMSQEEQKAFKQMWSKGKFMHGQQYGGFENMKPKEKEATRTFDKYLDRATLSEGIEVVRISDAQLLLGAGNKEANLEAIAKMEGERITCGANMSFSAAAEGLRIMPTGPAPTVEYTLKIEEGTTGAGMYIGDNRINIWGDKQREFMTNRDIWMTVGKSEVDEERGITKVELIFGGLMEHEYK